LMCAYTGAQLLRSPLIVLRARARARVRSLFFSLSLRSAIIHAAGLRDRVFNSLNFHQ